MEVGLRVPGSCFTQPGSLIKGKREMVCDTLVLAPLLTVGVFCLSTVACAASETCLVTYRCCFAASSQASKLFQGLLPAATARFLGREGRPLCRPLSTQRKLRMKSSSSHAELSCSVCTSCIAPRVITRCFCQTVSGFVCLRSIRHFHNGGQWSVQYLDG